MYISRKACEPQNAKIKKIYELERIDISISFLHKNPTDC